MSAHVRSTTRLAFFRRHVWFPALLLPSLVSCAERPGLDPALDSPFAASSESAGRYIAVIGGCNDCHTDGFAEGGGHVPEAEWLTGSVVGFRGPWGTSYPPNLRLTVQDMTEDQWVEMLGARIGLPPMPWPSVNQMNEADRRSLYRYLRSLGPKGIRSPTALTPGVEPTGPWFDFELHGLPADLVADAR